MTQTSMYFGQRRCIGYYTYSIACKGWHGIDARPVNWMRVHINPSVGINERLMLIGET